MGKNEFKIIASSAIRSETVRTSNDRLIDLPTAIDKLTISHNNQKIVKPFIMHTI